MFKRSVLIVRENYGEEKDIGKLQPITLLKQRDKCGWSNEVLQWSPSLGDAFFVGMFIIGNWKLSGAS